jgi:hypothetical protein
MDFFRTGVLAAALGCRAQCVYHWEQEWGFPRPCWNIVGTDGTPYTNRLYERNQVFSIQLLHHRFGYLRGPFRERVADFVAAVSLIFDIVPWFPIPEVTKFVGAVAAAERDRSEASTLESVAVAG